MAEIVPWAYTEDSLVRLWLWKTRHFVARVKADADENIAVYSWDIKDISTGKERLFEYGETRTFKEAENDILEIISKAYPIGAGYAAFAGSLMTTYTLRGGKKLDFAPYVGEICVVNYTPRNEPSGRAIGKIGLRNWDILLVLENGSTMVIPSTFIDSVEPLNKSNMMVTSATLPR